MIRPLWKQVRVAVMVCMLLQGLAHLLLLLHACQRRLQAEQLLFQVLKIVFKLLAHHCRLRTVCFGLLARLLCFISALCSLSQIMGQLFEPPAW